MRLDVDVKRLRFELRIRWVIHAWNRLRARQVVQISGQFAEFGASTLLLADLLFAQAVFVVIIEQLPNLVIFAGNVRQVLLARKEVVLILARVVAPIVPLNDFSLFVEEAQSSLHLDRVGSPSCVNSDHISPPALLNANDLPLHVLVAPFVSQHAPVRLDSDGCEALLLPLLFCFTNRSRCQLAQ